MNHEKEQPSYQPDHDGRLPLVSAEVDAAIKQEYVEQGGDFWRQIYERLQEENPFLAGFVQGIADKSDDPDGVIACGMLVYRYLESQEEADRLNRQLADR